MKIALTYTGSDEKHNNYVQWLKGNEDIEVVRIAAEENNLSKITNCDALVLSGGRDIHPKFYSCAQTNYPNAPKDFDVERDQFEIAAFQLAQETNLPTLGICRGLQLINCIQGGTLRQDLGEMLNEVHKAEGSADKLHQVNIKSDTLLADIIQAQHTCTNSAHHQAIDKLGKELRVNATTEDGIIEGIEWAHPSDKSFLLCIQWHPERMFKLMMESSPSSQAIRYRFLKEIKKSKAGK
jgi:putative glutamine amidotransferase